MLAAGLGSPLGTSAAVAGAAVLAAGLVAASVRGPRGLAGAGIAALVAAVALGVAGHATTIPPRAVGLVALATHLVAVGLWVGGLIVLLLALRRLEDRSLLVLLRRFSAVAPSIVAALLLAGLVLAWRQVGEPTALLRTTYGLLLLAKLALVAFFLTLAARNRFGLVPALARGEPGARRALARTIGLEIAGIASILALAAALGTTPPPRALRAATVASPAERVLELRDAEGRWARLAVRPGRPGFNRIEVRLVDRDRGPLSALEASLVATSPEHGIEPARLPLEPAGEGRWIATGPIFSLPGRWRLVIELLLDPFTTAELEGELRLE